MEIQPISKGERTRQLVRDTAYLLILEQGFAATSMRQIAERSGLALGSIYNHFSSKEAIFEAIILEYHPYHRIIPLIQSTAGDTLEEFVRNAARRIVDDLQNSPEFLNLFLIEFIEFKGKHAAMLFGTILPQIPAVAATLGRFRGEARDISGPILIRAFITFFFAYFFTQNALSAGLPEQFQTGSFDGFVDIFLYGILKPDA
jgi:AcrR family transcriptional regulator